MARYRYKQGSTVWHGFRYWKSEGLESGEILGWNTRYIAYTVGRITSKRIEIYSEETGESFQLNRETMERDGKQYHSRVHEYFFAVKPPPDKEPRFRFSWSIPQFRGDCLITLGLTQPYTRDDVRRAYKRLAKVAHPDLGGNQQAFIKLKEAHDSALRFAAQ